MATPVLPYLPFSSKNFQTPTAPPISISFGKVEPPTFMKGVRTMNCILVLLWCHCQKRINTYWQFCCLLHGLYDLYDLIFAFVRAWTVAVYFPKGVLSLPFYLSPSYLKICYPPKKTKYLIINQLIKIDNSIINNSEENKSILTWLGILTLYCSDGNYCTSSNVNSI